MPTVDLTPPYSEHFIRDFGGATVALAIVLTAAAISLERRLVIIVLIAYLAFSVPHTAFHVQHLDHATPAQAAALTAGLLAGVLLPVALLIVAVRLAAVPDSEHDEEPQHA